MKLTKNDQEKVISWITEKCGVLRCTCCGYSKWNVMDISAIILGYDTHTTRFHYHEGIPQIGLVCLNCGHMLYFNAGIMGFKPDIPNVEEVESDNKDNS